MPADSTERARPRRPPPDGAALEPYAPPVHPLERDREAPPAGRPPTAADLEMADLVDDAFRLRVDLERALRRGEGREGHPVLVGLRRAVADRTAEWGHVGPRSRPEPDADGPDDADGEPAALVVARALAEVAEEGDPDGRLAVLARVAGVRRELGWAGAGPLARDVVDQFSLALVHAEVVRACEAEVRRRAERTIGTPPTGGLGLDALSELAAAVGVPVPDGARDAGPGDDERRARAWARRLRRAEAGLRAAGRLVRHARKAGWLPAASPEVAEGEEEGIRLNGPPDPLEALSAPPPTTASAASESEARVRDRERAMLDAWPPPALVLWGDLVERNVPWSPFDYLPGYDADGRPREDGDWARLVVDPAAIRADLDVLDGGDAGRPRPSSPTWSADEYNLFVEHRDGRARRRGLEAGDLFGAQ